MYNKAKQQGFSIIELLIVVAIIAILLLVALPQYQNYTMRAQVSEALSLSAGPKQALGVIAATDGVFSSDTVTSIQAGSGKYADTGTVSFVKDTQATISYPFGNGANNALNGQSFVLTGDISNGQVNWSCGAGPSSPAVGNALPSSC